MNGLPLLDGDIAGRTDSRAQPATVAVLGDRHLRHHMRGGAADGLDALLSTVQMPSGIPVATVALNGAKNAAILAAQILALSDKRIAALLLRARQTMQEEMTAKEEWLQQELNTL